MNFRKKITANIPGVRERGKMHDEAHNWYYLSNNDNSIYSHYDKNQSTDDKGNIIHKFINKEGLGSIDNSQGDKWIARHKDGHPTYHDTLFDAMKMMHFNKSKIASMKKAEEITPPSQSVTPTQPRQKIPYSVWIKSKKSDGTTYEQWERRVDKLISAKFGLGMLDFPDWRSMDAYENNKTVEQGFKAFQRAQGAELKEMMFDTDLKIKSPVQYENLFFAQGDEANEYIDMIEDKGPDALIGYLNDAGALNSGDGDMTDKPHRGSGDYYKEFKDGWIVSWNYKIPYVGVEFKHKSKKAKMNFRKKISSKVKMARVETEGERTYEDKTVNLGDKVYSVNVTVDYAADWEPSTGNGWTEPREGGYFNVGFNIINFEAFDIDGNPVVDDEILNIIKEKFLKLYESEIEGKISNELLVSAESDEW